MTDFNSCRKTHHSIENMFTLKIFLNLCIIYHFCDGYNTVFDSRFSPNESEILNTDPFEYSNFVYVIAFPFSIDGRTFFYQNDLVPNDVDRRKWLIQELLSDGKIGVRTAEGNWTKPYDVLFPFAIDRKQYLYGQNLNDHSWILQELLPGGMMGKQTAHGSWQNLYQSVFPYFINNRHFFYGKNVLGGRWFLQELLSDGKMGTETAHGDSSVHEIGYEATFPFSIEGRTFFYRQRLSFHDWTIQELLPNGKMGRETAHGSWIKAYDVAFPFCIDGKQFFYGHSLYDRNWFIQELLPDGKMGKETTKGIWDVPYEFSFPFSFNNTQFYYRQNVNSRHWYIQKLLPDGQMGDETDRSSATGERKTSLKDVVTFHSIRATFNV